MPKLYSQVETFISAADLSAKQYFVAQLDANGKADLASAVTQDLLGIIMDGGAASGDPVAVCTAGVAKAISGGTINEGDRLTTDSAGKVIATTTAADELIGWALQAAASGDYVEIRVQRGIYAVT